MATPVAKCAERAHHTVCPSCSRMVPDWCAKDEPEAQAVEMTPTGSDLPQDDPVDAEEGLAEAPAPKRVRKAADASSGAALL